MRPSLERINSLHNGQQGDALGGIGPIYGPLGFYRDCQMEWGPPPPPMSNATGGTPFIHLPVPDGILRTMWLCNDPGGSGTP